MIDVGGPRMLRAAAKNFAHVDARLPAGRTTSACSPSCASDGEVSPRDAAAARGRRLLDSRAAYDAAIAAWFGERDEPFPDLLVSAFDKRLDLPYGENPHQRGRLLRSSAAPARSSCRASSSSHGKRALVQQPERPERGAAARCASSRCRPA